jgi:hypothetical protein
MDEKTIRELEAHNTELNARLAKLERELHPKPFVSEPFVRINPIDRLAMPTSVQAEIVGAVSDATIRDIVSDGRRGISRSASIIPAKPEAQGRPSVGSNGWIEPRPLQPPPGVGSRSWPRGERGGL